VVFILITACITQVFVRFQLMNNRYFVV